MDATGTAAWLAQQVLYYLGNASPYLLQLVLAILTLLFSQVMSNVGSTVILLCAPGRVRWDASIREGAKVRVGQALGVAALSRRG